MPRSKIILGLGIFIALLPVLGFPHSWESFFDILCGLLIVLLTILVGVDRRLTLKAKAQKRQARKRVLVEVEQDGEHIVYGRRATDVPLSSPEQLDNIQNEQSQAE